MRITANKQQAVFGILTFSLLAAFMIYQHQTRPTHTEIKPPNPTKTVAMPAMYSQTAIVASNDATKSKIDSTEIYSKIRMSVDRLGKNELPSREKLIENKLKKENLIERFNHHLLSERDILKLRKLALEKSLIAVKMIELKD